MKFPLPIGALGDSVCMPYLAIEGGSDVPRFFGSALDGVRGEGLVIVRAPPRQHDVVPFRLPGVDVREERASLASRPSFL